MKIVDKSKRNILQEIPQSCTHKSAEFQHIIGENFWIVDTIEYRIKCANLLQGFIQQILKIVSYSLNIIASNFNAWSQNTASSKNHAEMSPCDFRNPPIFLFKQRRDFLPRTFSDWWVVNSKCKAQTFTSEVETESNGSFSNWGSLRINQMTHSIIHNLAFSKK